MPPKQGLQFVFNRLFLSYVFDWIVLVIFLGIAGAFSFLNPVRRDFSLTDKQISYPYRKDTISIPVLGLIAILAPAIIIALLSLLFVRIPTGQDPFTPTRAQTWRRKLWEWHAGWLGLGLSVTLSLFLTQTMKNMFGVHRPDFLARCNPDVTNMASYVAGGYVSEYLEGTSVLVTYQICQNKNGAGVGLKEFMDGFRSFPSGHCTIAFAGLGYLALFLATKLSATLPHLPPAPNSDFPARNDRTTLVYRAAASRRQTAAPPLYLLVIVLIPVGAAIYVASTRYTDNKHHGFDILFASLEGIICAWFAFRWYHLPASRGAGWAWSARSPETAWGMNLGVGSYVMADEKGKTRSDRTGMTRRDISAGDIHLADLSPQGTVGTAQGSHESHQALV